jgi:hypothetical protein
MLWNDDLHNAERNMQNLLTIKSVIPDRKIPREKSMIVKEEHYPHCKSLQINPDQIHQCQINIVATSFLSYNLASETWL